MAEKSIEDLEGRVSDLRQEAAKERVRVRELKQEANQLKEKAKILQKHVSSLQNDLRKEREESSTLRSYDKRYRDIEEALKNILRSRYKTGLKPSDHDCSWCEMCDLKAWQTANKLVGDSL